MLQLTDPFVVQILNNTEAMLPDFILFDRNADGKTIIPIDSNICIYGPLKTRNDYYSYEEFMHYITDMRVPVKKIKLHASSGQKMVLGYTPMEFRDQNTTKLLQPGPPEDSAHTTFYLDSELSLHSRLIFNVPPYTHLMLFFYK